MSYIKILDGADVIGGSKVLLNSSKENILLDFGMNFKTFSKFFEEYLRPRTSRGLKDLLKIGLIPPIAGLYRDDLFPIDLINNSNEWANLKEPLVGVILSHAHVDHSGCVGYLRDDIPIYSSAVTSKILEVMQTTTKSDFVKDSFYIKEKTLSNDGLSIKSKGNIRKKRPFVELREEDYKIESLQCKFFPVDHSIYGASSIAIETYDGWIVYTGDLRLHGCRGNLTKNFINKASNLHPKVLIVEGTRILTDNNVSEDEVFENSLNAVKANSQKLVIADFGPRNIERLICFYNIALETQRRLIVLPQDFYLLEEIVDLDNDSINSLLLNDNLLIYNEPKGKREKWEEEIIANYKNKLVSPSDIKKEPSQYILSFSFWDINNLIDIDVNGGVYIYSSSEAYTEEQKIDLERLKNWLNFFDFEFIGDPQIDAGFHASGHIRRSELISLIEDISPEIIVPIHTENPYEFVNLFGKRVRVLKNGECLNLSSL